MWKKTEAKKEEAPCPHVALAAGAEGAAGELGLTFAEVLALVSKYGPAALQIIRDLAGLLARK